MLENEELWADAFAVAILSPNILKEKQPEMMNFLMWQVFGGLSQEPMQINFSETFKTHEKNVQTQIEQVSNPVAKERQEKYFAVFEQFVDRMNYRYLDGGNSGDDYYVYEP